MKDKDTKILEEAYGKVQENTSILQDIIQPVFNATTFDQAKEIALERINSSKIPDGMKHKMRVEIDLINRIDAPDRFKLTKLQTYIKNSMFKKLGMGV